MIISGKHHRRKTMDKRVDKSKEFIEEGMTLITETDSDRYLDQAARQRLSLIHISEPTRLRRISYAVFCLKKKK